MDIVLQKERSTTPPVSEELPADFLNVVDPQLLIDSNLDNIEVDDSAFQRFEDILVGDAPEPTEEETNGALEQLVENMQLSEDKGDVLTMETHKFVEFFSKINIVRNSALVAGVNLHKIFALKVPMGNTRDYPTSRWTKKAGLIKRASLTLLCSSSQRSQFTT